MTTRLRTIRRKLEAVTTKNGQEYLKIEGILETSGLSNTVIVANSNGGSDYQRDIKNPILTPKSRVGYSKFAAEFIRLSTQGFYSNDCNYSIQINLTDFEN